MHLIKNIGLVICTNVYLSPTKLYRSMFNAQSIRVDGLAQDRKKKAVSH